MLFLNPKPSFCEKLTHDREMELKEKKNPRKTIKSGRNEKTLSDVKTLEINQLGKNTKGQRGEDCLESWMLSVKVRVFRVVREVTDADKTELMIVSVIVVFLWKEINI